MHSRVTSGFRGYKTIFRATVVLGNVDVAFGAVCTLAMQFEVYEEYNIVRTIVCPPRL